MSEDAGIVDRNGQPVEAPELAPATPNDPAQAATDARRPDPAPVITPVPEPEPDAAVYTNPRDAIAKRFNERRTAHDSQFMGDHKPPFVEHGEREAAPVVDAPAAAAPVEQAATPAPEAPVAPAFMLKVRGKDVPVATRDDLLRIAEIEPHEASDIPDTLLVKIAQKQAAGLAFIDEGRSFRDQARVAAPAPAAPKAGDPPQQQPDPKEPTLQDLHKTAIEKTQIGTPDEAAEAWRAYDDRRDAESQQRRDAQSREDVAKQATVRDLRSFEESNQDIATNPAAADLLLMTATREMADDLRQLGLTDEQLRPALTNPEHMAEAFNRARNMGLSVRSNLDILNAAGSKVRAAMRMPAQAAQQPSAPAAPSRIEEKRALQAQPTRSGHPVSEPQAAPDQTASRKAAIARMVEGRRAPNVPAMAG